MNILVLGANGKVGKLIVKYLINEGHHVRSMLRKKEQSEPMKQLGAEVWLGDLEYDFSKAYKNIDIVIFTAGSGAHTGPDKTIDIDQNAAIRSMDIAKEFNIKLYVMVSAQGARSPETPSKIQHYFKAKNTADNYLINSGLDYIIFRPGRLTDDPANFKSEISKQIDSKGTTSRDNLAYAITKSLNIKETFNKTIEILDGQGPIDSELKRLA